jgi:hypothetical protein
MQEFPVGGVQNVLAHNNVGGAKSDNCNEEVA